MVTDFLLPPYSSPSSMVPKTNKWCLSIPQILRLHPVGPTVVLSTYKVMKALRQECRQRPRRTSRARALQRGLEVPGVVCRLRGHWGHWRHWGWDDWGHWGHWLGGLPGDRNRKDFVSLHLSPLSLLNLQVFGSSLWLSKALDALNSSKRFINLPSKPARNKTLTHVPRCWQPSIQISARKKTAKLNLNSTS